MSSESFSTSSDFNHLVQVANLWDGILFLSLTGFIDSARSETIINKSLTKIHNTDSPYLVVDISGVHAVDSAVAKHLFDLNSAASLMGCETVYCGLSPAVAHSMVSLNLDFQSVTTRTTIQAALNYCLAGQGYEVTKKPKSME